MFDYQDFNEQEIISLSKNLPNKMLRWLGANHPDNRTRKIFFLQTNIIIGEDSVINQNFIVSDDYESLLSIGDRVAISPNVTIICSSSPNNSNLKDYAMLYNNNSITSQKVVIKNDVWIGTQSVILPGITIGENSIIGAGSVVTKDIKKNSIVSGVPAKTKRMIT